MTAFPALTTATLRALNTLGQWLAQNDFATAPRPHDTDLIILAGNAVIPCIDAACRYAAHSNKPLLITGGVGHSTTFLYTAIAQHPRYNILATTGRSEAAIIKDIAHQFWQVPDGNIFIEGKSTNCGENASFSRQMLLSLSLQPQRIVLIQDPTMQRRSIATFARAWQGCEQPPTWLSWPGIVPELISDASATWFAGKHQGMWPIARYITLLLGEIPRLRDDASGYGPRGHDFIVHVDIPAAVMDAWQALQQDATLGQLMRGRAW